MIDIVGLKQNVSFLNWAVGTIFVLGLTAIIGSYLLLNADIGELNKSVAGQASTLSAIERSVTRIEDKMDGDQPQGSSSDKQVGQVRR